MKKFVAVLAGVLLMASASIASAITISNSGSILTADGHTYYDSGAEAVVLTDSDGISDSSTAFLFLELAGYAGSNTFGIYGYTQSGSTITIGETLEVFNGSASAITSTTLQFDILAGTVTNSTTSLSAAIGTTFGFYITTADGKTYYTHTSLNEDSFDHFKVYDTSDNVASSLLGSEIVLGIEDLFGGGDQDFDDMVVGVTDVAPVPEPGTIVLLGAGLLGLGIYGRRRAKK